MLFTTVISALVLAAGASARAVPNPVDLMKKSSHIVGKVITTCSKPNVLALAYDDGPYQYSSSLIDTLDAAGVKGTFFYTGTLYECIYNQSAAIKKAFEHGRMTHPHVGSLSAADLRTEMEKVEQAMVNIFGRKPAYMRPPYLETGGSVLSVMKELGYTIITDDVDSMDWNGATPAQSEQTFQKLHGHGHGHGHIPLMHETYETTVTTLTSWLIDWAKSNKLKIVTVAECLGDADGMYKEGTFEGNGVNTC
ncbi:carbohydrate esterase family 4 protein [Xylaria sp. CBS 124048]|nr:carbohydrate esterase family 4 protein [Xylaria sp. CBS 124048]